jgi:hypothetical protein
VRQAGPVTLASRVLAAIGLAPAQQRVPLSAALSRIGLSASLVISLFGTAITTGSLYLRSVATWKGSLRGLVKKEGAAALGRLAEEAQQAASETVAATRRLFQENYGRQLDVQQQAYQDKTGDRDADLVALQRLEGQLVTLQDRLEELTKEVSI